MGLGSPVVTRVLGLGFRAIWDVYGVGYPKVTRVFGLRVYGI